jgi:hypothetical protein
MQEGAFSFRDAVGKVVVGTRLLKPAAVVKGGRLYAGSLRVTGRR